MSLALSAEDRAMLDAIGASGNALVERAIGWAAINSGSYHRDGLAEMIEPLAEACTRLPGTIERLALPDVEQVGADGEVRRVAQAEALRLTVRPEAPVQVALTGHYDTVYPAETGFRSVTARADGTLNGPGIADMKGGISVMLGALEAFEKHPASAALGYTVLLSPDEEIGSLASAPRLAELARKAHVGMTYEPALADGTLVSARSGSGNFHIVVRGRAAHAGREFAYGRNAIAAAARIATALAALNGRREGLTINVARIDGGGPLNIVPDLAVLRFNVRLPGAGDTAWLDRAIAEAMREGEGEGLALSLHGGVNRPPKPFGAAQQGLFEAVRRVGELIGQPIAWQPSGGVCEGNNLLAAGLPGIDTLGVRGGDIHSEREFAIPESFAERAQLSALLLAKLAEGAIDARALREQAGAELTGTACGS
jgi:glutamate carboxypeptidase